VLTALDRPLAHHAATWSPDLVRARLVEAFEIEARLPEPKGPSRGNASAWPTMSREFEDLVGWSTEAREEYWHHMARAKGVHPYEVTRRDEAMAWLALLAAWPGEQRCLHAWAATTANRRSLARVMRIKGWRKGTFYRRVKAGSARIADSLNGKGVAVR